MALFVDATTGIHARGIGTVTDAIVGELRRRSEPIVIAGQHERRGPGIHERRIRIAATRPGRLLYQRVLMPLDLALQRRGRDSIDRVLLLDSYLPLLRLDRRRRYAVLIHDVLSLTHPEYWSRTELAVKHAAFGSIRRARPTVFTSSNHNARLIEEHLGLGARVIPFGCGQLTDVEAEQARFDDLPTPERQVVAVGAFDARKNLFGLIDAFELLSEREPELRLQLVGGGDRRDEQQLRARVAASPVAHRVSVERDPPRERVVELTKLASALAFPSYAEGFGLPIVEALALGTPVAANRLPEVRDWAGDAVTYADASDPSSFADAIASRLDASEADRRRGQELVRRFRWADCAEALTDW